MKNMVFASCALATASFGTPLLAQATTTAGAPVENVTPTTTVELTALHPDQLALLQSALKDQGADLEADGILGPKTREAFRAFKQEKGLKPGDMLDEATFAALSLNSEAMRHAH